MKAFRRPSAATVIAGVALFVSLGGGAYAATSGSVGHNQLAPNSVWHVNIGTRSVKANNLDANSAGHGVLRANSVWHINIGSGSVQKNNLSADILTELGRTGAPGPQGPAGPTGPQGPQGASGFTGAFYSIEQYTGIVGVGAIATAVCDPTNDANSQKYVAISGGVQNTDNNTNMTTNTGTLPIAASFPGRMNFTTFTPIPGRQDGWIIQFGRQGTSDTNIAVWALCVPVSIPQVVHTTPVAP